MFSSLKGEETEPAGPQRRPTKAVSFKGLGEGIDWPGGAGLTWQALFPGKEQREHVLKSLLPPRANLSLLSSSAQPTSDLLPVQHLLPVHPSTTGFQIPTLPSQNVSARSSSGNHPVQLPLNSWGSRGTGGEELLGVQRQSACLVSVALHLVQSEAP